MKKTHVHGPSFGTGRLSLAARARVAEGVAAASRFFLPTRRPGLNTPTRDASATQRAVPNNCAATTPQPARLVRAKKSAKRLAANQN